MSQDHYKCPRCNINIPIQDIEGYQSSGVCPFSRDPCPFKESARIDCGNRATGTSAKVGKRVWVEIQGIKGRVYYHNNVTGKDQWEKPDDFLAVHDGEMPNILKRGEDVKAAILQEQSKVDGDKQKHVS
mmetsp:Transcript_9108/g.14815  ORF Transcript_9108/g.14815 Transcript_9108/m.14815 type:complete len:129 (-) Transcript_9108:7-393(-)